MRDPKKRFSDRVEDYVRYRPGYPSAMLDCLASECGLGPSILRPGGFVALIWNQRKESPFNDDYEAMLHLFAREYAHVNERDRAAEPKLRAFFAPSVPELARFDHEQLFDEQGLRGRLMSSSYAPQAVDPMHAPMMQRLTEIFAKHASGGRVAFPYETVVWYGHLA